VAVEPDRGRIALTAKKSLVESDLPILSKFEDAKVGLLALGVVVKVGEKSLVVEFYNKVKAVVSAKEARCADFNPGTIGN
jgi:rRNA biogenesis protein RRP5